MQESVGDSAAGLRKLSKYWLCLEAERAMASGVFSVADNPDLLVSLLENNYRAELPLTMIKGGKKIVFEALHFFFFALFKKFSLSVQLFF